MLEELIAAQKSQGNLLTLKPVAIDLNIQLAGFASTNDGTDSKKIRSLQPIYYSTENSVCACLDGQPAVSDKTVKESEPFKGTDTIGKLWASG